MRPLLWKITTTLATAVLATACSQQASVPTAQPATPPGQAQAAKPSPTPVGAAEAAEETVEAETYAYDPVGKRDPFRSFVLEEIEASEDDTTKGPLEHFELGQLAVLGVVWDANNKRALIADPSGKGYVVKEGDVIGKNSGQVTRIDDNLVMVRETYVDYVGEQTLKEIEMHVRQGQGG